LGRCRRLRRHRNRLGLTGDSTAANRHFELVGDIGLVQRA